MLNLLIKRLMLLILSGMSFGLGLILLIGAGLPNRADYTGITFTSGLQSAVFAPEIDNLAPLFTLPTLATSKLSLADLRGRPVIINFWATWCEPCRVEMPELQRLYETDAVQIVGINVEESSEAVQRWRETFGLTFDLVLDSDGAVAAQYRLPGLPVTFVVSPEGVITQVFYGAVDMEVLRAAIR